MTFAQLDILRRVGERGRLGAKIPGDGRAARPWRSLIAAGYLKHPNSDDRTSLTARGLAAIGERKPFGEYVEQARARREAERARLYDSPRTSSPLGDAADRLAASARQLADAARDIPLDTRRKTR